MFQYEGYWVKVTDTLVRAWLQLPRQPVHCVVEGRHRGHVNMTTGYSTRHISAAYRTVVAGGWP